MASAFSLFRIVADYTGFSDAAQRDWRALVSSAPAAQENFDE